MANELAHKSVGAVYTRTEFEDVLLHVFNSQATGDMMIATSATQLSRLAIGTANQLLRVNAGATAPEWASSLSGLTLVSPVLTTPDINGGTVDLITSLTVANNVDIGNFNIRALSGTFDSLTSGRVPFASANGLLIDDADFTFATDTLTVTKIGAFEAAGAINFANQNMTNVDIDSGDIGAVTFSADNTWSVAQTGMTLTSPTINGTVATTGLTVPALTLSGSITGAAQTMTGMGSINGLTITANTGAITAGSWTATVISPVYGGTGVANNAASTLTITGAFALGLTISAGTSLTLPTTGTVATLAGSEALTNKTITITDDILFRLGTDSDQVFLNRTATLTADEELANVIVGTSVHPATAANSLIMSNITSDGDILMLGNDGGNSKAFLYFDSSFPNLVLYNVGGTWTGGASAWVIPAVTINGLTLGGVLSGVSATNYVDAGASYMEIRSTGNTVIKYVSAQANAVGTQISFYANSASPAANDWIAYWTFRGNTSTTAEQEMSYLLVVADVVTHATRTASIQWGLVNSGTPNLAMQLAAPGILTLDHSVRFDQSNDSAAVANEVSLGGYEIAAGERSLAISQENPVVAEAIGASDRTLPVRINGATYKIMLVAV